ncbi:AMP-binding protein [Rhizobacter sp. J219]|uniref:AMP-binding protein n=1 Tax=Rhizobacter sp. J219 TaxID=2898430 RepID=UPI002151D2BB|nr:AMP-binding protein [Rhizobacter sp. J219]MCR5882847.1 AMP-binding protein [Rhizobacter sp. J219]
MNPDHQLLVCGERRMSGSTLRLNAARAATGFASLGVGQGDAVAVMMRNDLPYLEAILAVNRLGAYLVAVNWHFQADEAGYLLADSGAKVLVVHADLLSQVATVVPPHVTVIVVDTPPDTTHAYGLAGGDAPLPDGTLRWADWRDGIEPWRAAPVPTLGTLLYTSGTTGRPKGVMRLPGTPAQHAGQLRVRALVNRARAGMRTAVVGPLYHAGPNAGARLALEMADVIVVMPRFDAELLLQAVERYRLTHLSLVPVMLVRLLKLSAAQRASYDVSTLENATHGGSPCPPEVRRAMIDWWGPILTETYGSTEAGLVTLGTSEDWLRFPGTVGKPVEGFSLRILDAEGHPLPAGEVGEVYVNPGDNALPFTYKNDPALRQSIERDGHITNGDMGYLNAEGYLFITDRKRDMVISGGVNIYPAEIEHVLLAHPEVLDAAVFGIPDPEYGEALAAAVVPAPGHSPTPESLRAWVRERLAGYKVPKVVDLRASLPREAMGKLFKNQLRAPYWANAGRNI